MIRRLATVGVALGLLAGACGSGGGGSAAALLQAAPTKTTDAQSSRMELVVERPAAQAGQPAPPFKANGEVDYKAQKGQMSFDLSELGLPGAPIPAVFEGNTVYVKLPAALIPGLDPAKPWVKIDTAAAASSGGVPGLTQGQGGDPSQALDYLRGASDDVRTVGTEDIRGVHTTHYTTTVDLQKAASGSPRAKQSIEALQKTLGSSKQPMDAWIDNEGRLRRLKYTIDLSKAKAAQTTPGSPGSVTFSLDLFDFGVPVQVAVPPFDQVVDGASLNGGR